MTSRDEVRVFRNQEHAFMARAFTSLFLIYAAGFVVLGAGGPSRVVVAVAGIALVVGSEVRWVPQGIYVESYGLTVRALLTTATLSWHEIDAVGLRRNYRWHLQAYVDLRDGRSVPARSLSAGAGWLPSLRQRVEDQVAELNDIVREHR